MGGWGRVTVGEVWMVFRTGDWLQGKVEIPRSGWTKPHCFQTCCYKRWLNIHTQLALEEPFPSFLLPLEGSSLVAGISMGREDQVGTHQATKRKCFMEPLEKAVCGQRRISFPETLRTKAHCQLIGELVSFVKLITFSSAK